MNYFAILCFLWAAVGIGSRVAMWKMGDRWKEWELNEAYGVKRPMAINVVLVVGLALVAYTWYQFFTTDVPHSWIISVLVSLTTIKIGTILFQYKAFRKFAVVMLNDPNKMRALNVGVLAYSAGLVAMGVLLY